MKIRTQGGKIVASEALYGVPDGQFEINGHEDDWQRNIQITRRDADNKHVVGAQHYDPLSTVYPDLLPLPDETEE